MEHGVATPPHDGAPIQFVDVFPLTPDRKVNLFPEEIAGDAPAGLYGYQPDPATERFPLALISPATEKTISSTLGELRERAAVLHIHPDDAAPRGDRAERRRSACSTASGELHCPANLTARRPRRARCRSRRACGGRTPTTAPRRTPWCRTRLTDLGAGACFNDARVQVALLGQTLIGRAAEALRLHETSPKHADSRPLGSWTWQLPLRAD